MRPSCASSFSTISRSMTWKVSTVISRSCAARISTKRDMCVPLKWCGRPTYMLNMAMVCCAPPRRSLIRTGWRIALIPTWSMASLRESGLAWTSGMFWRSRAFINTDFTIPSNLLGHCLCDGCADAFGVQADGSEQLRRIAVVDETVGQPQQQHAFFDAERSKGFAHCAARASHDLVLFHGDDQMMALGERSHELDVERLHEAHVGDRGVERLRRLQHRL